jgi:transmembrane sensor
MTRFSQLNDADQLRLEQAAEWQLRLQKEPSLELSSEYLAWISDLANAHALESVEAGWVTVGDLSTAPEVLALRRSALARAHVSGAKQWFPRRKMAALAVAALVVLSLGGLGLYQYLFAPAIYRTDVGERRVVALPDGSRMSMDSDTIVAVRYAKAERTLQLEQGRARFDVAHDVTRPFTVTAGQETVVAVGTSFNVERLGSTVFVTLIQGHIVIKSNDGSATAPTPPNVTPLPRPSVSLDAGQEMVARVDSTPVIATANLQAATAWETGHLIFKDITLAEAVERVNRYTERPIAIDPAVANLRLSGVFNAGDIGSFVSAVTSYLPVQATTNADNEILLQRHS